MGPTCHCHPPFFFLLFPHLPLFISPPLLFPDAMGRRRRAAAGGKGGSGARRLARWVSREDVGRSAMPKRHGWGLNGNGRRERCAAAAASEEMGEGWCGDRQGWRRRRDAHGPLPELRRTPPPPLQCPIPISRRFRTPSPLPSSNALVVRLRPLAGEVLGRPGESSECGRRWMPHPSLLPTHDGGCCRRSARRGLPL